MKTLAAFAFALLATPALAAPPVITCPPPQTTIENGGIYVTVTASDPDGDPVTLSLLNPPPRAIFDPPSGILQWVPSFTQAGSYNLQFQATAGGQSVQCTMPVTVLNNDRAPVIKCPAPIAAAIGTVVTATITATDLDVGDVLTFSSSALPAGATLSPQGAFSWPTVGRNPGTTTIPVSVSDGTVSANCSFTVTLSASTQVIPISCPGPQGAQALHAIDFDVTAQSIHNLPTTVNSTNLPVGATFVGGHFHWVPTALQVGTWYVPFQASNGADVPGECTVQVTVTSIPINPPQFTNCPGTVNGTEAVPIAFTVAATDPQGLPLTFTTSTLPQGASFNSGTRTFNWTPTYLQAGTYNVTITAYNGTNSAQCPVTLVIADQTALPTILCPGAQTVAERTLLSFTVAVSDPQNLPLTVTLTAPPPGATVTTAGAFSWKPTSTQSGAYTLHFNVSNGILASSCDVPVTVTNSFYAPPVIACPSDQVGVELRTMTLKILSTDADGDPPTFLGRNLPSGSSLSSTTGQFTWIPNATQSGTWSPQFIVTDGEQRDSCVVRIDVLDQDPAPGPYLARIFKVADIRPDQGGWVRVGFVGATADVGSVTGYDVWRRIDGPRVHGFSEGVLEAGAARTLGFPDGAWEAVGHVPALQSLDYLVAVPTRRDSTGAGRAWETYVVTAQGTSPTQWAVSTPDSGFSTDDLPPAAPALPNAARAGDAVTLTWGAVDALDLDRYVIVRGASESFAPAEGAVLGETTDLAFTDDAAPADAWYRVLARDVHGNTSSSPAVAGGGLAPLAFALTAPRPNPSRAGIAFAALVPRAQAATLSIVDARGRVVRVLARGVLPAGRTDFTWDRADASGRVQAAGVYVVRLETADGVRTRKVTLTR